MKRVLISFLVLGLLASVSLAAKAPAAKASAKAVSSGMTYGVGVDVGGTAYVRMNLSDSTAVDVGLTLNSAGAVAPATATTTMGLMGRYETLLSRISDQLKTVWGAGLAFNSVGAAATTTTITLTGYLGSELMINPNVALYGNITLLTFQSVSTAGASVTNFGILAGPALAYSGLRIYL